MMSDLIDRQTAIDAFEKDIMGGLNWDYILSNLPSVQPEIIRCKDCKHRTSYWGNCKLLEEKYHQSVLVGCDEFCSMAERRADDLQ